MIRIDGAWKDYYQQCLCARVLHNYIEYQRVAQKKILDLILVINRYLSYDLAVSIAQILAPGYHEFNRS